ncbi:MAG: Gfo/Idh/MocA family protein [Planctomycetota bacterium]|jgi:predicted dehydrogenase
MAIRWGIIGCGDVVWKRVARAIQNDPNSELVSLCRRNQEKLAAFCEEFGVENSSTAADDLITAADIDALYIATPVHLHQRQTIAAAQAGKHVLVEKPMALSTAECDDMINTCREASVRLGVAYYRPFYPVIQRITELVQDGTIGTVLSVSAITSTPFAINPGEDGYWRVIPGEGGGGSLMDVGSHRLELFLRLFGPIREVKAFCGTVAVDYESENVASLALQFESGIQGTLQCFFGTDTEQDEFAVLGSKGRLTARPLNGGSLVIERNTEREVEVHAPAENLNSPLIADFVAAIIEQRQPTVTGVDGREVNRVMELAYQNAGVAG